MRKLEKVAHQKASSFIWNNMSNCFKTTKLKILNWANIVNFKEIKE